MKVLKRTVIGVRFSEDYWTRKIRAPKQKPKGKTKFRSDKSSARNLDSANTDMQRLARDCTANIALKSEDSLIAAEGVETATIRWDADCHQRQFERQKRPEYDV